MKLLRQLSMVAAAIALLPGLLAAEAVTATEHQAAPATEAPAATTAAPALTPADAPTEAAAPAVPEESDPAIDLFVQKCASCHTVGKGDRVGPDLAGVHTRREAAWLTQMIQAPSKILDRDATARQLLVQFNNVRMPDLGLNAEQVSTLIDLIARCTDEPCNLVGKFTPVTEATEADVARGRALFTGELPIEAGAAPCISCHSVSTIGGIPGGTLSVDLTHAFARLGDEGLDAALKNPAFPVMNKVFGDRPLVEAEVFALRAFLDQANRTEQAAGSAWSLLLVGVLGAAATLAVLNAFWRRRLLGVRATIRGREASA